MPQTEPLSATITNDAGKQMVTIKSLSREGDKVKIVGSLLGQWDTDMYMEPDQLLNAVQIVLNSPALLSYLLDLPHILKESLPSDGK